MLEYLNTIDKRLYERFTTLVTNIKSASNSFYDSYLDLQEELLRIVARDEGIELQKHQSCGAILKKEEIKEFFTKKLLIDEHTYAKMGDYALKVNHHKHKGEKHIKKETVESYITLFYEVSCAYAKYKKIDTLPLEKDYIDYLYNCYERERERLRLENEEIEGEFKIRLDEFEKQQEKMRQEFKTVHNQINCVEVSNNHFDLREYIKDAGQYVVRGEKNIDFKNEKIICASVIFVFIISVIFASVFSTIGFGIYSTYSFIEGIFVLMLIHPAFKISTLGEIDVPNQFNHIFKFNYTPDGILIFTGIKIRYIVMTVLTVISALLNIVCVAGEGSPYMALAIVLEILVMAASITACILLYKLYYTYNKVLIVVKKNGKKDHLMFNMDTCTVEFIDKMKM